VIVWLGHVATMRKKTNEWWLTILIVVHNHELEPRLNNHLLAGRLREKEKKE